MENRDKLKQIVAGIFQKDPDEIGPEFSLTLRRLQGSVGRGILDGNLKHSLEMVDR